MSNNLKFALLGAAVTTVVLAAISSSIFFYLRYRSLASVAPTPSPTPTETIPTPFAPPVSLTPSPQDTPASPEIVTINPGSITWLEFPQVYKMVSPYVSSEVKSFHHTANFFDGSKLINAISQPEGPSPTVLERFIVTPDNQTYYLTTDERYYQDYFKPQIKLTNLKIDGLVVPDHLQTSKNTLSRYGHFMDDTLSYTQLKNPKFVEDTSFGRLYVVYQTAFSDTPGIYDRLFWLRLKDDTVVSYEITPDFVSDDKVPRVTWDNNQLNTQVFGQGFKGGCGAAYGNVIKNDSNLISNKTSVGHLPDNQPVYQVFDSSNPLVRRIYKMLDGNVAPRIEDWAKLHNHFLWQDKFGDWIVFISEQYAIQAECAKPVIYLYPQIDTTVTVKVGADITKSEPTYPAIGWKVLAHPNGDLNYQGKTYPSLFWEGMGHGLYPNISGRGFVVAKDELVSTIISHLSQLGLNSQETTDFLEFWQPKLPTTLLTRLTWLTTTEMNQLAPLAVSPRPNTVIRIFLDFAPLEKPINLIPQKLSAPARAGFTLVEWGGLLVK